MSKVAIKGGATGTATYTIEAPTGNTDRTLTLPDEAGTVLTSAEAICFRTTMSGDQAVGVDTDTKVQFNTETFDVGGGFDTSNNRFVVPSGQSGVYYFAAQITGLDVEGTEYWQISLNVNGTRASTAMFRSFAVSNGQTIWINIQDMYQLSAGDYVEVFAYHNDSVSNNIESDYARFTGLKLVGTL